jgi:hypothetical protein
VRQVKSTSGRESRSIPSPTSVAGAQSTAANPTHTLVPSASTGLSPGTKIGIGLGVSLVVILLAVGFAFICIRQRHSKKAIKARRNEAPYLDTDHEYKPELPGSVPTVKTYRKPELDAVTTSIAAAPMLNRGNSHQGTQELHQSELQPQAPEVASVPTTESQRSTELDPGPHGPASELDIAVPRPLGQVPPTSKPVTVSSSPTGQE